MHWSSLIWTNVAINSSLLDICFLHAMYTFLSANQRRPYFDKPAREKWSFGVHQKERSVWNRACIPLHFGLLNPSPPRFASVSQGNSSIDRLLMWNVNFFPDPQPNTLLNRLKLSIGHFTVLGLVSSPLSKREAEGDLVFIQTSFLFLWKLCFKNTS